MPLDQDTLTLKLVSQAEAGCEAALKAMPNSVRSVFAATDARDLTAALRLLRVIRASAEAKFAQKGQAQ